jgi:hypothetical protein
LVVYWLLFAYFAAGALLSSQPAQSGPRRSNPLLLLGGVLIAVLIGFRYEVGGDWGAYQRLFSYAGHANFDRLISSGDPAYNLLNWGGQQFVGEIWIVNLACGTIFAWGLVRFAQAQDDPWLAMLVAIPYLVVVVGMGYSRQAVAIGILMAGLAALQRGSSTIKFTVYVFAAALFHKTAVIGLLLVVVTRRRGLVLNLLVLIAAAILLYNLLLEQEMTRFFRGYLESQYASQGAAIRVTMSLVPATLFLLRRDRFGFDDLSRPLWRNFSLSALAFLVLLIVLPSSTVVDRLALYILPLQLAILPKVAGVYLERRLGRVIIIAYSLVVLFVWLNYAGHAHYWVPYRFYAIGG